MLQIKRKNADGAIRDIKSSPGTMITFDLELLGTTYMLAIGYGRHFTISAEHLSAKF